MPEASLLISGGSGMRIPLGMRFAEAAGTALDQASAAQLLPHPAAWCRRKAEHNLFGQGFYMGQSDPVLGGNIHWSETWWLWQAALNVLMQLKTESQSRRKDAKRRDQETPGPVPAAQRSFHTHNCIQRQESDMTAA